MGRRDGGAHTPAMSEYWCIERCGWRASPGRADALATPWSGVELPVPPAASQPVDGAGVLRLGRPVGTVPAPRTAEQDAPVPRR